MNWSELYAEIFGGMIKQYGSFLIVALSVAAIIEILLKLFIRKTSDRISQSNHKNLILVLMLLGMICAILWLIYYYSSYWGFTGN